MAEPARLVAGVTQVYGADYVSRVYGEIVPTPAERIIEAPDGHVISLAGRELLCLDTPGHAKHHICIVDKKTGGIFSGDMFGLSYREHDVDGRAFIFPTTTPTQFDPLAMHASIERLLSFRPEAIYLTHYGRVGNVVQLGSDLRRRLDAIVSIAQESGGTGTERHEKIKHALSAYLLSELSAHGCSLPAEHALDIWETDLELNSQGLEAWLDSRLKA
jgi:glyoxylase-like metal-dependent hydrolase (beta-lactamase superfamily II)